MARSINIYLTKEQREQLKKIMLKNHVSTTTICDKLIWITYKYMQTGSKYLQTDKDYKYLAEGYFQKTTGIKTSIKIPKCLKNNSLHEFAKGIQEKESMFITNCVYLYLTKDIKKYINEEGLKQYYTELNDELTKAKEQFYNYNNFVRSTRRAIRENKDYYKKAIAEEENR